jgi:flagellar assembly factor FliW
MRIDTTRFGEVEVAKNRTIDFPSGGMLGFGAYRRYALLKPAGQEIFYWMQSTDAPELAFFVTDPKLWVPDYDIKPGEIGLRSPDNNYQLLAVVNRHGGELAANLKGPVVINLDDRIAEQLVLTDLRWESRHPILYFS